MCFWEYMLVCGFPPSLQVELPDEPLLHIALGDAFLLGGGVGPAAVLTLPLSINQAPGPDGGTGHRPLEDQVLAHRHYTTAVRLWRAQEAQAIAVGSADPSANSSTASLEHTSGLAASLYPHHSFAHTHVWGPSLCDCLPCGGTADACAWPFFGRAGSTSSGSGGSLLNLRTATQLRLAWLTVAKGPSPDAVEAFDAAIAAVQAQDSPAGIPLDALLHVTRVGRALAGLLPSAPCGAVAGGGAQTASDPCIAAGVAKAVEPAVAAVGQQCDVLGPHSHPGPSAAHGAGSTQGKGPGPYWCLPRFLRQVAAIVLKQVGFVRA
jgi:hypothetical protein